MSDLHPMPVRLAELNELCLEGISKEEIARAAYNLAIKHVVQEYLYHTPDVIGASAAVRLMNKMELPK